MTEVLRAPQQSDAQSYYNPSGLRRSLPSTANLFSENSHSAPSSTKSSPTTSNTCLHDVAASPTSFSAPASFSDTSSIASSHPGDDSRPEPTLDGNASSSSAVLNIDTIVTRHGPTSVHSEASTVFETPLPSPAYTSDAAEISSVSETTVSNSPILTPTVHDDTAIKEQPSQQVDFLTHEWREEDIWSSWRHIVGNRKVYGERSRLENASWRQWIKTKHNLRTVPPATLNWLKDSDITWLYGPLKLAASYPVSQNVSEPPSRISKSNSFINKKPILKKRTMSEAMLQRSISSSSLLREAATTALFSQRRRPRRSDASSEFPDSKFSSEVPSRDQQVFSPSRTSSFCETPSDTQEKKHIRFDDVVEQCIAVHPSDLGVDMYESDEEPEMHPDGSSASSDDDGLMLKTKRRLGLRPKLSRRSSSCAKTIETLPATTLKYRTDSPDVSEQAQHHTFGRSWSNSAAAASRLSPSPSQETLRPSNPSANFLLPEDDEDENDHDVEGDDSDSSWSFGASNPKSSLGASGSRGRNSSAGGRTRSHTPGPRGGYDEDYDFRMEGMRRTGSGMFMPDDEDDQVSTGIFGRVSDTINTARDIAHVIWTVGWRT